MSLVKKEPPLTRVVVVVMCVYIGLWYPQVYDLIEKLGRAEEEKDQIQRNLQAPCASCVCVPCTFFISPNSVDALGALCHVDVPAVYYHRTQKRM